MKKGFTLIELLAVIVILAILALIVSPIISGVITDAKKASAERSMEGYIKAVEFAQIEYQGKNSGRYTKDLNDLTINYSGNEVTNLNVMFNNGLVTSAETTISGYLCEYQDKKTVCQKIIAPKSFSEDSWTTIAQAIKTNNTSKYNVGDKKSVTLDGYGTFKVRISNMFTPNECKNEGFSQTACGFVVEFEDVITPYNMSADLIYTNNRGGYPASVVYNLLQNNIYNSLPSDLKKVIIDTFVVSSHGSQETENFTSIDKLYLLSNKEVWNGWTNNDTSGSKTRQLDYYDNVGVSSSYKEAIKNYNGNPKHWWLRSAYLGNGGDFHSVTTTGYNSYRGSTNLDGISPAFRIG